MESENPNCESCGKSTLVRDYGDVYLCAACARAANKSQRRPPVVRFREEECGTVDAAGNVSSDADSGL